MTATAWQRCWSLVLTGVWGLRLASHIALRSRGTGEDPRYEELMAKAPGNPTLLRRSARSTCTQGVVMWFVSLPVQVGHVRADAGAGPR